PLQQDVDGDGVVDVCELCAGDDASGNPDGDGLCSDRDVCVFVADPSQGDGDGDGAGDACDARLEAGGWLGRVSGAREVLTAYVLRSVWAGDLDGDGQVDLLDDDPAWAPSRGDGSFGPRRAIGPPQDFQSVTAADLDGDGDTDLAGHGASGVAWY